MSNPVVTIIKTTPTGEEKFRYPAFVRVRNRDHLLVDAYFNRDAVTVDGLTLYRGDRFVEIYYRSRWYNIYEIYHQDSINLKGWYCNISLPAQIQRWKVSFTDLALDLLIYPDGTQVVLDVDEFDALSIDQSMRHRACQALEELRQHFLDPATITNFRLDSGAWRIGR